MHSPILGDYSGSFYPASSRGWIQIDETMQTALFDVPVANSGFRDSSFATNKTLPVHRWVPWIAGFSASFVDDSIRAYLPHKDSASCVLDPFSGVGTTLVQSYMQGLNVVGFEINPYAALAARVKLNAVGISVQGLIREIKSFEQFMEAAERSAKGQPRSEPPAGFAGRTELFSPKVERKVLYALDFIDAIENPDLRDMFRLGLGAVMVSFSNYSYEPSLTRRVVVGKSIIDDADVKLSIASRLQLMADDARWMQTQMASLCCQPRATMISNSIFSALECLEHRSFVDLVVTSPPYLNNYHYPRNTRPQLHWLGFASGTGYNGAREAQSFGKFWQTVRDSDPIALNFEMPALSQTIAAIRSRNTEKNCYGGPGWANYVATYFNDTYRFCKVLSDLLKPNAVAVIVLGNSIIQGIEVKTDRFFGKIGALAGLTFEDNHLLRSKRTGNSIIKSSVRVEEAKEKTVLYESAIVLRKPS